MMFDDVSSSGVGNRKGFIRTPPDSARSDEKMAHSFLKYYL
jgi:hypothetical protein